MKRYQSKIDTWLLLILIGVVVLGFFSGTSALFAGGRDAWWGVIPAIICVALPLWVLFGTHYTFQDDLLIVRGGPFRWRINVGTITSVTATNNPLSSPALSLDRLRIEHANGRAVMISPKDREGFLEELKAVRSRYA